MTKNQDLVNLREQYEKNMEMLDKVYSELMGQFDKEIVKKVEEDPKNGFK